MTQKSLQHVFCLLTCFVLASQPLRPQVNSGGVVAAPSAVVDFTNAGQTIPARKLVTEPATCTVGEQYFNTTSNVLKVCTATNTWTTPAAPTGTSGGIAYFYNSGAMGSSSTLNANNVVVGGGAGGAPKATGVTIDGSNNISTPGTVSTGGSVHGKLSLGELPANGTQTVGWEAPDSIATSLSLMFPNAPPAANSMMVFGVPSANVSNFTFAVPDATLSVTSSTIGVNTAAIPTRAMLADNRDASIQMTTSSVSSGGTLYVGCSTNNTPAGNTISSYSVGMSFLVAFNANSTVGTPTANSLNVCAVGPMALMWNKSGTLTNVTTNEITGGAAPQPLYRVTVISGSAMLVEPTNFSLSGGHPIPFVIDGGGSAITTGTQKTYRTVNFACTISKVDIQADVSGSITIDVWKAAGAIPTSGNKISASAPITLASAQINQNSALTGWTTTVAAGDVFGFSVATATTVTHVEGTIWCQ